MKALTLTQPWATLVAIRAKPVETRSWTTPYRGPLAIHAAKGFPREAIELCFEQPFVSSLPAASIALPSELPRGAVIAVCRLAGCFRITDQDRDDYELATGEHIVLSATDFAFGDFTPGRFGWLLADVQPLPEPIPARGALGLWDWSHSPVWEHGP